MKIKPKGNPRGRPFRRADGLIVDHRRNAGGKPFIKIHQRLSKIVADQLDERAPADVVQGLGLAPESSYGTCISRCAVEMAARGDLGAARFVFECTKRPRFASTSIKIRKGTFMLYTRMRAR
jgi:hypothetical protein